MKIWKKYLSLMLSLALCLCLSACGDTGTVDDTSDGSSWEDSSAPDSFEGLVKDSEQMSNLYVYGGAWTGEDGGSLLVATNDTVTRSASRCTMPAKS